MLKVWRKISWLWVLVHLIVLAVEDVKSGFLSVHVLGSLGITGAVVSLLSGRPAAVLPGVILLAAGYLSGEKIGYGDGYLALALGMWMDTPELTGLLGTGILAAVCVSAVSGRKELPLAPFLTAAYILRGWN